MNMELAKFRAIEYVERGDLTNAVMSMLSDIEKIPGASLQERGAFGAALGMDGISKAKRGETEAVREWINGFNG